MRPVAAARHALVGLVGIAVLAPLAPSTRAGPLEARALLEAARALPRHPWPPRVRAFRSALAAAHPTDRTHGRALAALASTCQDAGLVHASLAWRAQRTLLGPSRSAGRLGAVLDYALALRREHDLEAARTPLEEVLDLGARVAPWLARRALEALAEDAGAEGDVARLEVLRDRAHALRAPPSLRLALHDLLGRAHLGAGDVRAAEHALEDAERTWREAEHAEEREARRCAKLWLDLELRDALTEALVVRGE